MLDQQFSPSSPTFSLEVFVCDTFSIKIFMGVDKKLKRNIILLDPLKTKFSFSFPNF